MMTITMAGGATAEAYLSGSGYGQRPGVLFFMDAIGLRPRIRDMADEISSWGYVVLAPNVLYREGSASETSPVGDLLAPGSREAFMPEAMARVGRLTPAMSLADLEDYVRALGAIANLQKPFGVTGYCMGARLAVRAACARPDVVAACGGFHGGRLVTDDPDSPHLGLPNARAEFVFGHADHDPSMPVQAAARLGAALADAGLIAINEICPDAPHGYTMSDTAMYQEQACRWHFEQLRALFDRTLL